MKFWEELLARDFHVAYQDGIFSKDDAYDYRKNIVAAASVSLRSQAYLRVQFLDETAAHHRDFGLPRSARRGLRQFINNNLIELDLLQRGVSQTSLEDIVPDNGAMPKMKCAGAAARKKVYFRNVRHLTDLYNELAKRRSAA